MTPINIRLLDLKSFELQLRLRRIQPNKGYVLAINAALQSFDHLLILEQFPSYDLENEAARFPFFQQLADNINTFLDFIGDLEQDPDTKDLWVIFDEDARGIGYSYALAAFVINGLDIEAAIAQVLSLDRRATFDYHSICAFDHTFGTNGKLINLAEEYEATGVVVSPEGVTYLKEGFV